MPDSIFPDVLSTNAAAHFAVISEFTLPKAWNRVRDKLILVIVIENLRSVSAEISVQIVNEGVGRLKIGDGNICVGAARSVLGNRCQRRNESGGFLAV
jgi:hypothetical protein